MKKYFLITFLSISIFCADAPKDFRRQKNTEMSYGLIAEELNFGQEDTSLAVITGDPIWVEYFDNKASADEVIEIRSELDKMSSLVKTPNVDSKTKELSLRLSQLLKNCHYRLSSHLTADELKRSTYTYVVNKAYANMID